LKATKKLITEAINRSKRLSNAITFTVSNFTNNYKQTIPLGHTRVCFICREVFDNKTGLIQVKLLHLNVILVDRTLNNLTVCSCNRLSNCIKNLDARDFQKAISNEGL